MKKLFLALIILFSVIGAVRAESKGFYADVNDELINLPASAAMVGADLSISTGNTSFSSPANLPFDSLHRIELSYANYFHNSFSTSLLSYNGLAPNNIGYSITAGYIYIPDIEISDTTEDGVAYISGTRNCSAIYFRAGLGKSFDLSRTIAFSLGAALQAKRIRLIGYNGYGVGMDAGAKILFRKTGVSAALLVENITSSFTYWSKDFHQWAYPHIRAGIGWERSIPYIYGKIRLAYTTPDLLANEGVNYYSDDEMQGDISVPDPQWRSVYKNPDMLIKAARAGIEYIIMDRVVLRGGLTRGKAGFGAGVNLFKERACIDFAYLFHDLAGTYQLGLSYRW